MNVLLISTYELGHQPFGLASPAAWLKAAGARVTCLDLAVESLRPDAVATADLIACYLPMHTATRLAAPVIEQMRAINPQAHLCCYGLYAPMNEPYLRGLGVQTILGGEFETGLVALYRRLNERSTALPDQPEPRISLARQDFLPPDRASLPALDSYAFLDTAGEHRLAGYTEASRGCKHTCRHCPIVPVYEGRFRIVQHDVVLEDIRRQVASGARHITFGDPDFLNGPRHAIDLVQALHAEFPAITYDATIKVEHLLKHADLLPVLRDTGCLFVTSAVEAVDDRILQIFDKRHTRTDFVRVVELFRATGLTLNPTFVAFTPWISLRGYADLLATIADLDLIVNVAPVQYAIRLLIPAGSKLLDLPDVGALVGPFDPAGLCYPWQHPDMRVDQLQSDVMRIVKAAHTLSRQAIFEQVWKRVQDIQDVPVALPVYAGLSRAPIPSLSEPWYC